MSEYNLNLTEQEINYILLVLAKQPYIDVVELIEKIRKQATEQAETNQQ